MEVRIVVVVCVHLSRMKKDQVCQASESCFPEFLLHPAILLRLRIQHVIKSCSILLSVQSGCRRRR
jgi:hypothetical protein